MTVYVIELGLWDMGSWDWRSEFMNSLGKSQFSNHAVSLFPHVSQSVLEPPMLPADLFVLSPGYEVPADLATVPRPLVNTFCGSRCPQRRFECLVWCCRHCDVKRIISCRNDVMNPYKRSHPDRNAVLWLLTTNWTVSHVCPTMCSPGTVPEALTVILVK